MAQNEAMGPDNHDAYDYAERIRERLPRRLQEIREAAGFTKYGLARESGITVSVRSPAAPSCRASAKSRSFLGDGFVEVQQDVGNERPRGGLVRAFAFGFFKEIEQGAVLIGAGGAGGALLEHAC